MSLNTKTLDKIERLSHHRWGVTTEEGVFLATLAERVPENGLIVEIGTLHGRSTSFLAAGSKDSVRVYAIDPWVGPRYHDMVKATVYLTRMDLIDRIRLIKGFSANVAKSFTGTVDMLYIDGDHSYESVKTDYIMWFPFLKSGGIIAFHDYVMPKYPGVCKVVDDMASKHTKFIGTAGKVWSGQK